MIPEVLGSYQLSTDRYFTKSVVSRNKYYSLFFFLRTGKFDLANISANGFWS